MATATYPAPPPYYKLYKEYSTNPSSASEPPPPVEGTYVCFGSNYTTDDVLPSLEEQGVRQLYPKGQTSVCSLLEEFIDIELLRVTSFPALIICYRPLDFKKELRSLNRELQLQLHLLEPADVLVERP